MNDGVRLLLGFAAGGLAVAATTLLAERHGSRLGGYIGGLPSTLAVALLFVALTGGRDAAIRASGIAPLSFGINGLYVLLFVALTPLGFYWSMGLALAAWAAAQSAIIIHGAPPLTFSLAAWGICFGLCWLGFSRWFRVPPQPSTGLSTVRESCCCGRPSAALSWRPPPRPRCGGGPSPGVSWPPCPWSLSARCSLPTAAWAWRLPAPWPVRWSSAP
jgi:hypothetical protein